MNDGDDSTDDFQISSDGTMVKDRVIGALTLFVSGDGVTNDGSVGDQSHQDATLLRRGGGGERVQVAQQRHQKITQFLNGQNHQSNSKHLHIAPQVLCVGLLLPLFLH